VKRIGLIFDIFAPIIQTLQINPNPNVTTWYYFVISLSVKQAGSRTGARNMEQFPLQYMVDFTLPPDLPEEFVSRIPRQRAAVNRLLSEGKVLNYALSLENAKLWAVFSVESEAELMELISELPLTPYMKVRISELTVYNTAAAITPMYSMN